jgi:thiol-disulfide isomerase/thioredoxin
LSYSTTRRRSFASTHARTLLALSLIALAPCACRKEDPPEQTAAEPAPEQPKAADTLETVTAEALLSKLKASGRKGTLVNAWASFCGPCKREIPMLEGLAKKLRPRGIDVVLVTVDEPADQAKAEAFLRERGIELTSYVAARPLSEFKSGMNPRWPGMLPASFLFDRGGTLRYYWGGEAFENEIVPVLEALADGKPIEGESSPLVAPENAQ